MKPRPHITGLRLAATLGMFGFQCACAPSPRITTFADPPCRSAVRAAMRDLLANLEPGPSAALLAESAVAEPDNGRPSSFLASNPAYRNRYRFVAAPRSSGCALILESVTIQPGFNASTDPSVRDAQGPIGKGPHLERPLPGCSCKK